MNNKEYEPLTLAAGKERLRHWWHDLNKPAIILFRGKHSFAACGAYKLVADLPVTASFTPTQTVACRADIASAVELINSAASPLLIAVGGGAVIDTAKAALAFSGAKQLTATITGFFNGGKLTPLADIPFITIPTTAGSGSEATSFAVVYDQQKKYSLEHSTLLPQGVLHIPELLAACPRAAALAAGYDVIAQGIEACWAIKGDANSRPFALRAIKLAFPELQNFANGGKFSYRALQEAAFCAGLAIATTRTTAPHAFSYSLTAHYGLAHGLAVSFTLPTLLNAIENMTPEDCLDPRGVSYTKVRLNDILDNLGFRDAKAAATALRELATKCGLPSPEKLFLKNSPQKIHETLLTIFTEVNQERLANHPQKITSNKLAELICQNK